MIKSSVLDISELEHLASLTPERAVRGASRFLRHLMRDSLFVAEQILPLLDEIGSSAGEPSIARRFDAPKGGPSLQVFVWPVGAGTQIHDHSCWGAFGCLVGALVEERYERLDDGTRPGHARLQKRWRRSWGAGTGVSTLLPYDGGIHRVANASDTPVVSFHLYGPVGPVDGRDYDPARDYVCDRFE